MKSGGGVNWIDLAEDRDRWLAFVNAVMTLGFEKNTENFLAR